MVETCKNINVYLSDLSGKIRWTREEALTQIVAVEMIDLPLSDSEGAIENELKNKDGRFEKIKYTLIRGVNVNLI